ncbi:MAG: bifunctional methylenetetrahydrofolate dehydrogenase/methenyltetrahydrofolate cyclohydrolase FolD [Nitrospinae bacterium]|nr:bifunctional methylenetetrahydrofolate dehydrogenase/methenyltetrahydrofolate cyclohydrolase FolD [Nitrospinota bacterium]
MATIIDGKQVAASIKGEVARETARIKEERGETVGLAVVLVGADPASQVYVRLKKKDCEEVGITSFGYDLPATTPMEELLALIDRLNADPAVNGILVQLPLPKGMDEDLVLDRIAVEKDVDGFHPANVGLLSQKKATLAACTPAGCIELLDRYHVPIEGAHAVVVGRSNIVGKPLAMMLINRSATVTVAHSRTRDLASVTRQADILLAAVGKAKMITADMVKPGAVVIDVGTTKVGDKLCGDVDFDAVKEVASAITPVPGGVGPMTRAMLLANTLTAYKAQRGLPR